MKIEGIQTIFIYDVLPQPQAPAAISANSEIRFQKIDYFVSSNIDLYSISILKNIFLTQPLKKIMQNAVQVAVHKKGMLYKKLVVYLLNYILKMHSVELIQF